jgi:hypothetical protein
MKRHVLPLILISLATVLGLWLLINPAPRVAQAQGDQSILQVLYTAQATTTTFATAVPIRNIGQAFHQVHIVMADGAGGACDISEAGETVIRLYGSHEPVGATVAHLFRIGSTIAEFAGYLPVNPGPAAPGATATNRGQGYIYATGVYRDIRLVIEDLAPDCVVSAWYSGSIQGDLNPALVSANGGYLGGTFIVPFDVSTIGSNDIIPGVTSVSGTCCQVSIEDLTVYNTVTQDVTITFGLNTWYNFPAWAEGCALLREKTPGVPKVYGALGDPFSISLTVGRVTGEVTYHYE